MLLDVLTTTAIQTSGRTEIACCSPVIRCLKMLSAKKRDALILQEQANERKKA